MRFKLCIPVLDSSTRRSTDGSTACDRIVRSKRRRDISSRSQRQFTQRHRLQDLQHRSQLGWEHMSRVYISDRPKFGSVPVPAEFHAGTGISVSAPVPVPVPVSAHVYFWIGFQLWKFIIQFGSVPVLAQFWFRSDHLCTLAVPQLSLPIFGNFWNKSSGSKCRK